MVQENAIKAQINKKFIYNECFNYLDENDKIEIIERLFDNTSFCVGFFNGEKSLFFIIVDVMPNFLHVREVAGKLRVLGISASYKFIDVFVTGLAKYLNIHEVRFKGERVIHKNKSFMYGYFPVDNSDFSKMVH